MPLRLIPPGKRKGNRFYIARGRIDGRQFEVSTETTDRQAAEAFKDRLAVALRDEGRVPRRSATTFAGAVDRYLAARKPVQNERRYLAVLKAHFRGQKLDSIMPMDIADAAHKLYPGASNQTKNRQVFTPVASVLHFGAENGLCTYRKIRKLPEVKPAKRRAPSVVLGRLIAGAEDPDLRRLLVLISYQGFRITETLGMTWDRVDIEALTIDLYIPKRRVWKRIEMHPAVAEELAKVEPEDRRGKLLRWHHRSAAYRFLGPLCKKLRVRFTPHMARHSFASDLGDQNASAADIATAGS